MKAPSCKTPLDVIRLHVLDSRLQGQSVILLPSEAHASLFVKSLANIHLINQHCIQDLR